MTQPLDDVLAKIDADFDRSVDRLCDLLRIPSVSTDAKYAGDVRRAADWLVSDLRSLGFEASARATNGHPIVIGHHGGPNGSRNGRAAPAAMPARGDVPHILYYGHYDVQPPDPLELWKSPPFEPSIVEGPHGKRVVARGAVDDKGQTMMFLEAFRAWQRVTGSLPVRVTVLLEGEEESGSKSLDPFLKDNVAELKADVCVVSDTGMWNVKTPAITYMLRGLVYTQVTLHGPSHDLHSGMYGGSIVNPINALCDVLAQLHDKKRRVTVPNFYDDVRELSAAEKRQWRSLKFSEKQFVGGAGFKSSVGEASRSVLERIWSRPTCDVNGIWGGYTGEGAKTVIPAHASAKVSFRLVPEQDPRKVLKGFGKFLKDRTPPGCRWEIKEFGASPAIRVPTESPWLDAAQRGLTSIFNRRPVLVGSGGSIPVVGSIERILGFDSLLVGFGLDDDRVHSPNEKFELICFRNGIKSHAAMLEEFARVDGQEKARSRGGRMKPAKKRRKR